MAKEKSGFKLGKALLVVCIKLCLSIAAFYVISKKITVNPLTYLHSSQWPYFLAALLVASSLLFFQAWRWKTILRIFTAKLSFQNCLVAVWFGHLINNLVPSGSGGDLLRSYTLRYASIEQGKWRWVGAFLAEKYCAATSALLLACIAMLSPISFHLPWALMGLILLLLSGLVLGPMLSLKLLSYLKESAINKIFNLFHKMAAVFVTTFTHRLGRKAFWSSLLINFGMSLMFYLIALGLETPLTLAECMFVVPTFTLLTTLPISFAGWGIRELSCVGLLAFFGVPSETAVIISVIYGLTNLFSSLPGILVAYPFVSNLRFIASHKTVGAA